MVHSRAACCERPKFFRARSTVVSVIGAAFNRRLDDFRTTDVRVSALTA
jgi:hypothetical protein